MTLELLTPTVAHGGQRSTAMWTGKVRARAAAGGFWGVGEAAFC